MEENQKNIQQNSPAQGQVPAGSYQQADSQLLNDSKASVGSDDLSQGVTGRELNPEFGDAADSSAEKLGANSRDDASPLNTATV